MGKEAESVENLLINIGNIPFDTLVKYIFEEKDIIIDDDEHETIKEAIKKAKRKYKKHENPQMVDYIIDKLYFQLALKIARRTGSPYIIQYVQHLIDLANIKIFFRVERWEDESPDKVGLLADGGKIPFKSFFLSEDEFIEATKDTEYKDLIDKSVKEMREKNQFIELENEVENFIAKYLRRRRFEAIGPEVVMNYFIAKKNNAMLTRLVLIGKMNQIPADMIRQNARKLYSNVD
jgi:V/A-type H+-transporting ATPase subunit C